MGFSEGDVSDQQALVFGKWNKFNNVARTRGTYAGVKYSIKQDMTFTYNGYKVVASNLTPEMVQKIVDSGK